MWRLAPPLTASVWLLLTMPVPHQDPVLLLHHCDNGSHPMDKVAVTTPIPCPIPKVLSDPPSLCRVFHSWSICFSHIHAALMGVRCVWGMKGRFYKVNSSSRTRLNVEVIWSFTSVPAVLHIWGYIDPYRGTISISVYTAQLQHIRCSVLLQWTKHTHTHTHTHSYSQ